jgi:hypothetical protein
MWPVLQALDLGAIRSIAAVKKVGGPGLFPVTNLKTQDDVVKQLVKIVKKRVYFHRVCSPFYTLHFGVRFRTHARDREKNRRKKG